MSKLLIENLATAFGLDPSGLNPQQYRNLCLIIDCTLEAYDANEDHSYVPFTSSLLSNKNELDHQKLEDIITGLARAYKEGVFKELETEIVPNLEGMLEKLCPYLGITEREVISKLVSYVPTNIREYEKALSENKSAYTESLKFKGDSAALTSALNSFSDHFAKLYEQLYHIERLNPSELRFVFNEEKKCIEAKNAQTLTLLSKSDKKGYFFKKKTTPYQPNEKELVIFFLKTLVVMNKLKKQINCNKISEENVKLIIDQLKPLFRSEVLKNLSLIERMEIKDLLKSAHDLLPRDANRKSMAELYSAFVMSSDSLRNWKTLNEFNKDNKIHRVILIGKDDIADSEVMATLELMIKKHPLENIVITFDPNDVPKINRQNTELENFPFTLQVIGHGSLKKEDVTINANLGPFRGNAVETGKKVAELVNMCPLIDHVRLTGCFTGRVDEQADLQKGLIEKVPKTRTERRTLIFTTELPLGHNEPFVPNSAVVSCWNNIKKGNREISLTASPGIIEADLEIGHMTWKSSESQKRVDDDVKEIRVTTKEGKKSPTRRMTQVYQATTHIASNKSETLKQPESESEEEEKKEKKGPMSPMVR